MITIWIEKPVIVLSTHIIFDDTAFSLESGVGISVSILELQWSFSSIDCSWNVKYHLKC